jgi:hypothetical protein
LFVYLCVCLFVFVHVVHGFSHFIMSMTLCVCVCVPMTLCANDDIVWWCHERCAINGAVVIVCCR